MSKFGDIAYKHVSDNKREYLIITILFFIGLLFGIFFINNVSDAQILEINDYLNNLILNIRQNKNINFFLLFKKSLFNNFFIAIILWFGATTIIGIPLVHGTILLKGFSIGYTISSIIMCFGIWNGIIIVITLMTIHNIIYVPTIFAICISRNEII